MFGKKSTKAINLFNQHYNDLTLDTHTAESKLQGAVNSVCRKQGALGLYLKNSPDYNKAADDLIKAKQHLHNALAVFEDCQRQMQEYYKENKEQMEVDTRKPTDKDSHGLVEIFYQNWVRGSQYSVLSK